MYKNKKVGLVLPTRYSSERLNGKILYDFNGITQLEIMIKRALKSNYLDKIILALTDNEEGSKPIENFIKTTPLRALIEVVKGFDKDLPLRCLKAADAFNIDIIVDTSHDCTFIDPCLMDILIQRLFEYKADYSANCITRTFPNGFDLQVYTKEVYKRVIETKYYWRYTGWNIWHYREELNPTPKIINLEASSEYYYPHWHLCLDTEEDKEVITRIINGLNIKEQYPNYKHIIEFLLKNPDILKINEKVVDTKLLEEEIK